LYELDWVTRTSLIMGGLLILIGAILICILTLDLLNIIDLSLLLGGQAWTAWFILLIGALDLVAGILLLKG